MSTVAAPSRYANVRRAVAERPWVITEPMLRAVCDIVDARVAGEHLSAQEIAARVGDRESSRASSSAGPVAVLSLYGVLIPRANLMTEMSGGTSLEGFQASLTEAVNDPDVETVVLDVDSPGGSVDLVPETAAMVRETRRTKPVVAVANTLMASGAYWIASQADEVIASPSAGVGSIGVYAMHEDHSSEDEQYGIARTLVYAGRYKVEGSSHAPLDAEATARWQTVVDRWYRTFTADVAKGRGVSAAEVREGYGEGRVLDASEAKAAGMVDRVETLSQTLARLSRPVQVPARSRTTATQGGRRMSTTTAQRLRAQDDDADPREEREEDEAVDAPEDEPKPRPKPEEGDGTPESAPEPERTPESAPAASAPKTVTVDAAVWDDLQARITRLEAQEAERSQAALNAERESVLAQGVREGRFLPAQRGDYAALANGRDGNATAEGVARLRAHVDGLPQGRRSPVAGEIGGTGKGEQAADTVPERVRASFALPTQNGRS